jgi:hypothetical protein
MTFWVRVMRLFRTPDVTPLPQGERVEMVYIFGKDT